MADAYLKPQSPILYKNNYIYPLTTHDQVILADGSRWDGTIVSTSQTINGHSLSENIVLTAADVGAVKKVGDEMTGRLIIRSTAEIKGDGYSALRYVNTNNEPMISVCTGNTAVKTQFVIQMWNVDQNGKENRYSEKYWFPTVTEGLTGDRDHHILTTKTAVAINQGGTGASTAEQALANLGAFSNKGGTITGDVTATGTITATKIIGAVYA